MTDAPPPDPKLPDTKLAGYWLGFLTDQWEWEAPLNAAELEQAKAAAREALERLVEDEKPELACVTLLQDGLKIGVWDWVERQAYWSWL